MIFAVTCAQCRKVFDRGYHPGFARAAKSQYCSKSCLREASAEKSLKSLPARFWAFVDKRTEDECWPWKGAILGFGYGHTAAAGKKITAHRLSYLLHYGSIPDGMCVLHRCDNPPCCNPRHLFVGTKIDNIDDMNAKGRGSKPPVRLGCAVNTNKLSETQVLEIFGSDGTYTALAQKFGVSRKTIKAIKTGRNWSHLTKCPPVQQRSSFQRRFG